ncbi:MAG: hypothetical protein LVQ75_01560 [Candidatus Babeliales bacterium]|jgi:hypothetical protein
MKLSLRWIFDHLKADFKKHSVDAIVAALCSKTAEVEGCQVVDWNLKDFSIVQVTAVDKEQVTALCFELKQIVKLSARTDAKIGASYLLKKMAISMPGRNWQIFPQPKKGYSRNYLFRKRASRSMEKII